jgi:TonB-dependent SusC/RagA subfamily outer membrane receptor
MRLLKNLSLPPGTKFLSGLGALLFLPFLVFAQAKTITGTVKDESGKPVSGASVTIKKQNTGTTTNETGSFSIAAATGDVLIISAVTFESIEVTVGTENTVNVQLRTKATELSDVVVVGYGTKTKRDIGGGVLTVDQKLLQNRPVTNTLDALQGTTPGLVITRTNGQPGSEGLTARIRGITSLGVNNSPLVIIDGVEGNLSSLNPNDIQSISVLEDAASAAIYGAKAGGGVILVTTKAGRENQKTRFDLTTMYTIVLPLPVRKC